MGALIDRENMTDAEWFEFVQQTQGREIEQLNRENVRLRRELQKKGDAILASKLTTKKQRHDYLPQPTGKIGAGTSAEWCHAITDKTYAARILADEMLKVDTSLAASIEDKIFAMEASEFKSWATSVAELIAMCVSWLDSKGVGEIARCALYKEINERANNEH